MLAQPALLNGLYGVFTAIRRGANEYQRTLLASVRARIGLHQPGSIFPSRYGLNEEQIAWGQLVGLQHLLCGFWHMMSKVLINAQMGNIDLCLRHPKQMDDVLLRGCTDGNNGICTRRDGLVKLAFFALESKWSDLRIMRAQYQKIVQGHNALHS